MKILLLILTFLFAMSSFAATSKTVSYKSGDETVQGMLFTPSGKGPFPGIIVIHEWWGLNDWVKEQASKLADQGYVALAVDLYRGKVATTPDEAHELMRGVPEDRAALARPIASMTSWSVAVPISAPVSSVTTQRPLGLDSAELSRSRSGSP